MISSSTPPPQSSEPPRVAAAAIVTMVGKGMTPKQILRLFPSLKLEDIRAALLRSADLVRDEEASLLADDPVGAIIAAAQQSSGLSEEEATTLAVEETRAERAERALRKK